MSLHTHILYEPHFTFTTSLSSFLTHQAPKMVKPTIAQAAAAALFLSTTVSAFPPPGEPGRHPHGGPIPSPGPKSHPKPGVARSNIPPACPNPIVRKEWRSLTSKEQTDYISAVKCLISLPSIATSVGGALNRFDDFQGVHSMQTPDIHFVVCPIVPSVLVYTREKIANRQKGPLPPLAPIHGPPLRDHPAHLLLL